MRAPLVHFWNVEAAKLLVECGANVQVQNNNGQTLLHLASKGGYHDTLRLLGRGADVDAQDGNHSTPLHLASSQWKIEAAKLIECGASARFPISLTTKNTLANSKQPQFFV